MSYHTLVQITPPNNFWKFVKFCTISSLALSFCGLLFQIWQLMLHWVKFEAQLFHGPLLQQNYLPVTFVSINFTKILKELRIGSSHTLQEFFFLPFHYLHPYLFPSLLSEITSKNFPFIYLVVLLLWDTQRFQLQFNSVAQSCLTLCDPMDCSMSGFPVHH